MFNLGKEKESPLVNGLYRVDLHGRSLDKIDKEVLSVHYTGDRARAAKDQKGLSGTVAVYKEGILARSYDEPWNIQLEMIAEANNKLQQQSPFWKVIAPPNAATAIEVALEVYKHHGFIVFGWDGWNLTRVGDGFLFAGDFVPGKAVVVRDDYEPDARYERIGVLPLIVKV